MLLRASVAGLDSLRKMHPYLYGSVWEPAPPGVDYPKRPIPLTDEQLGRGRRGAGGRE
jgi:hypothetical protein